MNFPEAVFAARCSATKSANVRARSGRTLVDCNAFYAQFERVDANQVFSVEMQALSPMWDDKNRRPMAIIRPIRYAAGA